MVLRYINKLIKIFFLALSSKICWLITYIKFVFNGVKFNTDYIAHGVPIINVSLKGKVIIGKKFAMNNGKYRNMIGRQQRCYFIVEKGGELAIGNNVGISSTAIVCHNKISIGNNIRIGGGVVIYDSDFHSLNAQHRNNIPEIKNSVRTAPINIKDGVFVGAHSIILKGVTIGSNSIIGAGSVVTKSVPDNEIWGGNPAKCLKKI